MEQLQVVDFVFISFYLFLSNGVISSVYSVLSPQRYSVCVVRCWFLFLSNVMQQMCSFIYEDYADLLLLLSFLIEISLWFVMPAIQQMSKNCTELSITNHQSPPQFTTFFIDSNDQSRNDNHIIVYFPGNLSTCCLYASSNIHLRITSISISFSITNI